VTGGGRLAGVDMAGDDNGDMGFDGHGGERYKGKLRLDKNRDRS
jgi:hypothetical protein